MKKVRLRSKYFSLNHILDLLTERGRKELLAPEVVDKLPFDNVLILAPHPDDDVIGCGGAIIKHTRAGDRVSIVCLTDGSRGNLEGRRDESLVATRKEEMRRAHRLLGVDNTYCLDVEDGRLSPSDSVITRVAEIVAEVSPAAVYTPFFVDYHRDHVVTSNIFLRSSAKCGFNGRCIAYEINSPLFPNRILDITDCVDLKIDAVKSFESQLSVNNYIQTIIEGLNRFRTNSVMLGNGYAEGFYICDIQFYQHLVEGYFRG